uniref:Glutamate dehydrogenase n=1 Tax=Rhodnius prolixus TaxID=13249 RepID=T1HER2_RHOPR
MPDHVKKAESAEDPTVNDMILYYFHRAIDHIKPNLRKIVDEERLLLSDELKKFRVEGILKLISNCTFLAEITYPVKTDCGGYDHITAYKVHHCMHKTPMFGGILLHPCITLEDVMGLSALNTFKSALLSIPFGGSQGAIRVDPEDYTDNDIQKITRRYIVELLKKNVIGPGIDCGLNDMNVGHQEISWMTDAYLKTFGSTDINASAIMTGKPTFGGGIHGKMSSVGWGIFYFLDCLLNKEFILEATCIEPGWKGKTFIVEGFGKVGRNAALCLKNAGAKMVGVIEKDSSIFDANGLDPQDLAAYKFTKKGLKGYPKGKAVPEGEIRSSECDILLLCAWHKSIKKSNADSIKAKIVVEGADAPITPAADKILRDKKILVVPDVCASGGSVASSYIEWLKNVQHVTFGRLPSSVERGCFYHILLSIVRFLTQFGKNLSAMNESLKKSVGEKASILLSEENRQKFFNTSEKDIIRRTLAKNLTDSACMVTKSAQEHKLGTNLRIAAYCKAIIRVFKSYQAAGLTV